MMRWMKSVAIATLAVLATVGVAQDRAAVAPLVPQPSAERSATELALSADPTGAKQLTKADVDAWLDGLMPFALGKTGIPGAVIVVVKDGQVVTQRGFGYADVAKRTPVDPARTLFRPGSISKLFTWTAVMQQVEAGKLDLDADVNQYLDFKIPPYQGKPAPSACPLTVIFPRATWT